MAAGEGMMARGDELSPARRGACPRGRGARPRAPGGSVAGLMGLALVALLAGAFVVWSKPAAAASGRISIESGERMRTAILVQHRRLKQARRPLVIVLRASREKGQRVRHSLGLDEMASSAGPVLVYPDPLGGRWSEAPGPEAARDAVFIRDLIARLVADGLVDRRKVFLVGVSNGGFTALRLACDSTQLFAGAAAVISAAPADLGASCRPSRPLPLLMIVGTADPFIPYAGGKAALPESKIDVLSVDAALAIFGKAAGCGEGRTTTPIPDRDPHDGTRSYLDKLNGCKVPVEALRVEGGGHSIPGHLSRGETASRGAHSNDFEAARTIWDFFSRLGG